MEQSQPFAGSRIAIFIPRLLIRFYQVVTLGSAPRCRFVPSCSEYAHDALWRKGLILGLAAGAIRLLKCHPWHSGGFDPVR